MVGVFRVAAVVGVGPGLGAAVARRFAREGYVVALLARDEAKLAAVQSDIETLGGAALAVPCDATDADAVAAAFDRIRTELGAPEVLVYNAGAFAMGGVLDIEPADFERCWRVNCMGAFLAAQQVLAEMVAMGRGTVLFTGATAALRGSSKFASLAVGKFGLRALAQSLAREFGPQGVHVAHVIVDGMVALESSKARFPDRPDDAWIDPDAVADVYWGLHGQQRSAWTLEADLRPHSESF